jgi:hypothetical protein
METIHLDRLGESGLRLPPFLGGIVERGCVPVARFHRLEKHQPCYAVGIPRYIPDLFALIDPSNHPINHGIRKLLGFVGAFPLEELD